MIWLNFCYHQQFLKLADLKTAEQITKTANEFVEINMGVCFEIRKNVTQHIYLFRILNVKAMNSNG